MLTDIRPIVERLLQKLVLAGLPLVAACDDTRALGGSGGAGGTEGGGSGGAVGTGGGAGGIRGDGGAPDRGTGGRGTGGINGDGGAPDRGTGGRGTGGDNGSGGRGTGGAGLPPDGGSVACQPFSITCGARPTCISPGDAGTSIPVPLTTAMIDFVPDDPRWVDLYRACIAVGGDCGPDCTGLCVAALRASGANFFAGTYLQCGLTCGEPNRLQITYVAAICGRRPGSGGAGCIPVPAEVGPLLGRYLAEAAELEAASVPAFGRLARDLVAHGAPAHLVRAARAARADEARHWRRTRAVALRHGGHPVRRALDPTRFASLEEVAVDNVVEGCVRETFGALVAAHQAATAGDPEIRALMAGICEDELGHAALAWQIDAWATAALGPGFRERRSQAALAAMRELVGAQALPVAAELQTEAGLPGPARAQALLAEAWAALWQPHFA
jgi:hypothetical protein